MRRELELFFTALGFFTRIPVPRWVPYSSERLNHASRYFPAAGWVVGGVCAALTYACSEIWPWPVALLVGMAASLLLTGAFHEDGLADSADGLGGGWEKAQVLTIMKDSRLGTYGAVALVTALAAKFATLHAMGAHGAALALLAAHPFSRLCAVSLISAMDYVRDDVGAKAKPLAERMSRGELLIAAVFGFLPLLLVGPRPAIAALVAGFVLTIAWARYLKRRIGGYTGDCLGAAQQIAEIGCYLVWILK
jgi:adenosylcobinamide-GDP ribazoletransferase